MMRAVLLVVCGILVASCGSPTGPSKPQPTTLNYSPTVSGFGYALQDVTVFAQPAQVTVTLRWTDNRKDLDLYWTNALCIFSNASFVGTGCQIIAQSVSTSGTLETVSGPAAAGATVRLFILNFNAAPEPTTLTVVAQP